jgi:hypothetical protein
MIPGRLTVRGSAWPGFGKGKFRMGSYPGPVFAAGKFNPWFFMGLPLIGGNRVLMF